MDAPLHTADERRRVETLRAYEILDTSPEVTYDRIARLAALASDVSVAVVAFVDDSRQWHKAVYGTGVREVDRSSSPVEVALRAPGVVAYEDVRADPRFAGSPFVTEVGVRFFAAAPLETPEGYRLGALAVADAAPGMLSDVQRTMLADLAEMVMRELEQRRAQQAFQQQLEETEQFFLRCPEPLCMASLEGAFLQVNPAFAETTGYTIEELLDRPFLDMVHPDDYDETVEVVRRLAAGEEIDTFTIRVAHKDGSYRWFEWNSLVCERGIIYAAARDVTEQLRIKRQLQRQAELQQRVAQLSVQFINAPVEAIDRLIERALEQVGRFVGADYSRIFLFDETRTHLRNTHEWACDTVPSRKAQLQRLPREERSWGLACLERGEPVIVHDFEALPDDAAAVRKGARQQGIRSCLTVPLVQHGALAGFVDFCTAHDRRAWTDESVALLHTMSGLFASALQRKHVEGALHASTERLEALLKNLPVILFSTDRAGRIELLTGKGLDRLGWAPNELVGQSLAEAEHTLPEAAHHLERALVGEAGSFEIAIGDSAFVIRYSPRRDAAGHIEGMIGVGVDITERKRTERRLVQIQEAVESASDAIAIIDDTGTFVYVNPAFERLFGTSCADLNAEDHVMARLFVDEAQGRHIVETVRGGTSWQGEVAMKARDGSVLDVALRGSPIVDGAGEIIGVVGIHTDITERKRVEEALRETEKLAATGRMAAGIAHEINNPLAGIKNAFQLVKQGISDAHPYHHFVRRIEQEVERIQRIVHQMYTLYTPDPEAPSSISMAALLADVRLVLQPTAREKRVMLELDVDDASERVWLPEGYVRQVIYNLVSNAIQAVASEGAIRIVAVHEDEEVVLRVEDEGPGIPDEVRERIFEPFFSAREPAASGQRGLGLGLSISKTLVEVMGGTIHVETEPGEGTVFTVRLPKVRPDASKLGRGVAGLNP